MNMKVEVIMKYAIDDNLIPISHLICPIERLQELKLLLKPQVLYLFCVVGLHQSLLLCVDLMHN